MRAYEIYISQFHRLSQKTEELVINVAQTEQSIVTMNNQQYNQRPGYNYAAAPYPFNYQQPYTPMPPYPTQPYGMPTPVPHYGYYPPPMIPPDVSQTYVPINPPIYGPSVQYGQTRMASPSPYPPYHTPPAYNYNTTNMISRPPMPAYYPQVGQGQYYPQMPPSSSGNTVNNGAKQAATTPETPKETPGESSRKLSEVSNTVSLYYISSTLRNPF